MVLRRRNRIRVARLRGGVQGLAADRRSPSPDEHNYGGAADRTEDVRPHPRVGWRTSLGGAGLRLTHTVPQEWAYEGSPFTFVTGGLESALEQAKAVAGDKDVGVIGASLVQQCLRAGLLDDIHVDHVPVLLGDGVRLFDHLGTGPIELEITRMIEGTGVTHIQFRIAK